MDQLEGKRIIHLAAQSSDVDVDNIRVTVEVHVPHRFGNQGAREHLAWALRDPRVTSLVVGASSVAQLDDNVAALANMHFTSEELERIDQYAVDGDIDLWRGPATS